MSSLWKEISGATWEATPLNEELDLAAGSVRLVRFGEGAEGGVALLVQPGVYVRVNGLPILGGLCILQHRDEVLVDSQRVYFSSESTPLVMAFRLEAGARRPTCPVCRGPVGENDPAVRCPGCGRWFHQIEASEGRRGKTCWTYAATCRFCSHPSSLAGEPVWRPEQEESHVDLVH
jgi:hypothetical protein